MRRLALPRAVIGIAWSSFHGWIGVLGGRDGREVRPYILARGLHVDV
jgi:hypothetical protein